MKSARRAYLQKSLNRESLLEIETTQKSLFEFVFDRVFAKIPRYVYLEVVDEDGDSTVCTLRRTYAGSLEETSNRTEDD